MDVAARHLEHHRAGGLLRAERVQNCSECQSHHDGLARDLQQRVRSTNTFNNNQCVCFVRVHVCARVCVHVLVCMYRAGGLLRAERAQNCSECQPHHDVLQEIFNKGYAVLTHIQQ